MVSNGGRSFLMGESVVEECDGCPREQPSGVCLSYASPASKWRGGHRCPLAPVIRGTANTQKQLDPIKKSKRAMKGK